MKVPWIKFRRRNQNKLYDPKMAEALREFKKNLIDTITPYVEPVLKWLKKRIR